MAHATTESYTYGHTLSLHDALPICPVPGVAARSPRRQCGDHRLANQSNRAHRHGPCTLQGRRALSLPGSRCRPAYAQGTLNGCVADPRRSEEHTSELQSLMRLSYAVFCLKKKKKSNTILQIY